jgi:hypothetical protein
MYCDHFVFCFWLILTWHFLVCLNLKLWTQGFLPILSHISSPFFSGYFWRWGVPVTICLSWPWTSILPSSASQVAKITDVRHSHLAPVTQDSYLNQFYLKFTLKFKTKREEKYFMGSNLNLFHSVLSVIWSRNKAPNFRNSYSKVEKFGLADWLKLSVCLGSTKPLSSNPSTHTHKKNWESKVEKFLVLWLIFQNC